MFHAFAVIWFSCSCAVRHRLWNAVVVNVLERWNIQTENATAITRLSRFPETLAVVQQMCRHHVPTEAKRILWIRGMRLRIAATCFCLASRFVPCLCPAFPAAMASRAQTSPQVSSYQSRLRDSGASDPPAPLGLKIPPKKHFTTHHTELGFDFNFVCLLCRRGSPRAIAHTETEKDTQDSYECHQDQASRIHR